MNKTELEKNIKTLDKPGRDKFKKFCVNLGLEYFEPENEKLAYDCGFKYKGKTYIVELKDRDPKYEQYDEFILEKDKAERLLKWKQRLEATGVFYVNFFANNIYLFKIDNKVLQMPSKLMWMNAVTADPSTQKIQKEVYLLKKTTARKMTI